MKRRAGFSLIEVTLSIGVMAFTMIPLVALLGTGLSAGHEAEAQNQSGRLMMQVTQAMMAAGESGGEWTAMLPLEDVKWDAGGAIAAGPLYFDQEMNRVANANLGSYVVYLRSEAMLAGEMRKVAAVVAWPATARVVWGGGRAKVTGASGHVRNLSHRVEK